METINNKMNEKVFLFFTTHQDQFMVLEPSSKDINAVLNLLRRWVRLYAVRSAVVAKQ
jgi:hypothetical protein